MITERELWWLAGLLEGEGYFGYTGRTHKVMIRMTDEDTIIRAALMFGMLTGNEHNIREETPSEVRATSKNTFVVQLTGENARIVMRSLVSLMGSRRRRKIWQSLNCFAEPKRIVNQVNILELLGQNKESA